MAYVLLQLILLNECRLETKYTSRYSHSWINLTWILYIYALIAILVTIKVNQLYDSYIWPLPQIYYVPPVNVCINLNIDIADKMLGSNLITKQTSAEGVPVSRVMVAQALNIVEEKYLAILLDRSAGGPVVVASSEGGMDIEEVASTKPEMIFKFPINIEDGMSINTALEIARCLYFPLQYLDQVADEILKLYKMFIKVDATQIEINPFGLTDDGQIICFDCKMNFDDNAKFRQQQIFEFQDDTETDQREVEALKHNLNYVGMNGNIGCLVNGAGLAMATMDIIKLYNGEPANFLDVGGGVKEEQVLSAFKLITKDPQVYT